VANTEEIPVFRHSALIASAGRAYSGVDTTNNAFFLLPSLEPFTALRSSCLLVGFLIRARSENSSFATEWMILLSKKALPFSPHWTVLIDGVLISASHPL